VAADSQVSRRRFLKWAFGGLGGAVAAGGGGLAYATQIEPNWLAVEHLTLTLPRLAAPFDGYRVVQFSDIHMGHPLSRAMLAQIVDTVNAQQPDLVAITGDFVSAAPEQVAGDLVAELSRLRAHDGTVAVLGNHDQWVGPDVVHAVIHDSGMVDLSNDVYTVSRHGAAFHIGGVDDVWEQLDRLNEVLAKLPGNEAAMLLAHEPDFADSSATCGRFDLQISGHSHGGQVYLPFIGPLVTKPYGARYPIGLYRVQHMYQYTNRGVGTSGYNIRFNCRPEITVFTLRSPKTSAT
jgi:predicted MPP superfamily phosphohydrolase